MLGVIIATGLVGLQVAFIVADQLAKVWQWADTLGNRLLVMGLGWLLLIGWSLQGRHDR